MTGDSELTARIRRVLADVPDVTEQRMFGSTGFRLRRGGLAGATLLSTLNLWLRHPTF
jgi:hypothetical protein